MRPAAQYFDRRRVFPKISCAFILTGLLSACTSPPDSSPDVESASTVSWPNYESAAAQGFIEFCSSQYQDAQQRISALEQHEVKEAMLLSELNQLERVLNRTLGRASLYANVHPDPEYREAADACDQQFTGLISELTLSQSIFSQVADLDLDNAPVNERRYAANLLKDFRRSGVDLDEQAQARVKTLQDDINVLGQDFYKNIREDVRYVEVDATDDLSGLPQEFIDAHTDEASGKVRFSTDYPDYLPVMQYANNDALRKSLYVEFRNRGYPANEAVLKSLLEKRFELAQLLGYDNYAAYITEVQMIETPERAQQFIDAMNDMATPTADRDYQLLLTELRELDSSANSVGDWQKTYLSERLKKSLYQVDSQEVRTYFQYDRVKEGIFELTEKLFNVEIRPWAEGQPWDESVEAFEILENGEVLGQFYLDMHPREGKYKHAAAFTLQDGLAGQQLPIKALVCNFPAGNDLMEHSQVETFLHEFGHLLHGIFGGHQTWMAQSGIKTERDFVEAPSQMLEEWIWSPDVLALFAINSDGEAIPAELIEKMKAARDFGIGLFTRHQMFYAALSLNYYNRDPAELDLDALAIELQNHYSNFAYVDGTHFQLSFGHLNGYSAVYYTYMWSLVIAKDMFSEFEKQGLLNTELAARYRSKVLEPGGSRDANDLVEDFLNRPYNIDAFARSFGTESAQ